MEIKKVLNELSIFRMIFFRDIKVNDVFIDDSSKNPFEDYFVYKVIDVRKNHILYERFTFDSNNSLIGYGDEPKSQSKTTFLFLRKKYYVAYHGHVDIAQLLISSEVKRFLINHDAGIDAKDVVERFLIRSGADVNAKDINGDTALIDAARCGRVHIARLLIDNGADVNAKNKYGKTALYIAKALKHDSVVELLEQHGAE